jgi:hypothetical protein
VPIKHQSTEIYNFQYLCLEQSFLKKTSSAGARLDLGKPGGRLTSKLARETKDEFVITIADDIALSVPARLPACDF